MREELRTLFWLQWKLTVSMFRRRKDAQGWLRIAQMGFKVLQLVFTFPMFVLMGIGLAVGLALLTPQAALEVAMMANVGMLFIWLLMPSSYSGQMVERFEMSRLFPHPISFRSIVVGSTLVSMLSVTGLWSVPLLLGEIVGLAWHAPLALPLIALGALPTLALLVLSGRIMDDLFDLVAGDRRLQGIMLFLLMTPFLLLSVGQWFFQLSSNNYEEVPALLDRILGPERLAALGQVDTVSGFLETLELSRLLVWLPPGWGTAAMGYPGIGQWGQGLLFLLLSLAFVAALLWFHARITRRLMEGRSVTIGTERVRARRLGWQLPGPPAFWAVVRKDWLHLLRNPMPRRMLFAAPFSTVAMVPALMQLQGGDSLLERAAPVLIGSFVVLLLNMMFSMSLIGNYWGTFDREGFATLALSPLDRRYFLASQNLTISAFAIASYAVLLVVVAALSGAWEMVGLGLYMGLCLQISCAPAYNLAAVLGPFRTQLKWQGQGRGSAWGLIGLLAAPPVLALVLVPYLFWKPGLILSLPVALVYSVAVYGFTLQPLANYLQRREYDVLQKVSHEE